MNEYYLSTNGIAIGSEDDHLLIGDWANIGLASGQPAGCRSFIYSYLAVDMVMTSWLRRRARMVPVVVVRVCTFVLKVRLVLLAIGGSVDQFFVEQGSRGTIVL